MALVDIDALLTVGDAAKILGCSPQAVRKMEQRGTLSRAGTYRGTRLFSVDEVRRVKALRDVRPTPWHPIVRAS